jgi:hypothetical protein
LKKHDKTVVLDTRSRFMRNVVNQQPFTHYPRLLEMLQEMEEIFKEIDALQGDKARPLEEEERLFLEAIRGLNQEASSMQREEKADLGGASTSDPEHSADDQPAARDAATAAGAACQTHRSAPASATVVPELASGGDADREEKGTDTAPSSKVSDADHSARPPTAAVADEVAETEGANVGKRRRV